jgi:hypothetical protein
MYTPQLMWGERRITMWRWTECVFDYYDEAHKEGQIADWLDFLEGDEGARVTEVHIAHARTNIIVVVARVEYTEPVEEAEHVGED